MWHIFYLYSICPCFLIYQLLHSYGSSFAWRDTVTCIMAIIFFYLYRGLSIVFDLYQGLDSAVSSWPLYSRTPSWWMGKPGAPGTYKYITMNKKDNLSTFFNQNILSVFISILYSICYILLVNLREYYLIIIFILSLSKSISNRLVLGFHPNMNQIK